MSNWLGVLLLAGAALLVRQGLAARARRRRELRPAGPVTGRSLQDFADIIRPIVLFGVALAGLEIAAAYFLMGGDEWLSPFAFAACLALLAAYAFWFVCRTTQPPGSPTRHTER